MPQSLQWKRLFDNGRQFTEDRRSQARQLASELVAQGQHTTSQVSAAVEELFERSRRRTDDLQDTVRTGVQRQLSALGIATKDDVAALERRVTQGATRTTKARRAVEHADNAIHERPGTNARESQAVDSDAVR